MSSPEKSTPIFVQCQVVSPENIHTHDIIWNEQIVVMNIYVYT